MALYINQKDGYHSFDTDESGNFVQRTPDMKENIILTDISHEFDGLCTENGDMHFLLQSAKGELVYLKCEGGTWKKYNIFKNKDGVCKISGILLTYAGSLMCAFYTLEHSGRILLAKHVFSSANLYATPEIADTVDRHREYCICTDGAFNTHLLYRDSAGRYKEIVYDSRFVTMAEYRRQASGDVYGLCTVCDGKLLHSCYVAVHKNYTALMYASGDEAKEKIITFGIPRNTKVSMRINGDEITILWQERGIMMQAASYDGGESFSKPRSLGKGMNLERMREQGIRHGMYASDYSVEKSSNNRNHTSGSMKERNLYMQKYPNTTQSSASDFTDISRQEFIFKLSQIEAEVAKMSSNLNKICSFLDTLTEFKATAQKDVFTPKTQTLADVGEKDEENIKLFESMDIDEVLPQRSENIGEVSTQ